MDKKDFEYLQRRNLETFFQSKTLYASGINGEFYKMIRAREGAPSITKQVFDSELDVNKEGFYGALACLGYSLSYLTSEKRYREGADIVAFADIVNSPQSDDERLLGELKGYFKGNDRYVLGDMQNYFDEVESSLKGGIV